FMADVQDRIQKHRQARKEGTVREDDPIAPVARALAEEAWVLCFDEFSVTDIADAMILSRLFSALFANGVVLVATSNVAPQDLYGDGLNRKLFLPFIGILERHAQVIALDADKDYRDFLAIAGRFSTVFIDHVPVLGEGMRNEAKRFILLIDTLYDHHVRLVVSAAAPPAELYTAKRGNEVFEFERTASRLIEMQSHEWLEDWVERQKATLTEAQQARA
ncbi:MAG: cell division protein ZapE, partial [Mesorhizobium sp.]